MNYQPINPTTPFGRHQGLAAALGKTLRKLSFTSTSIKNYLGSDATQALYRGEPGAVLYKCSNPNQSRDDESMASLIQVFLLRQSVTKTVLEQLLGGDLARWLISSECFAPCGDGFAVAFDIRPYELHGRDFLVISDRDAAVSRVVQDKDHVLGVGAASLSLLQATPCTRVGSVLDLGTGSGVQALANAAFAKEVVATDVLPRALELAQATFEANEITSVALKEGPWFEPVAGRKFDRVIANPPFVVGPAAVGHIYRDSGLGLDGATELVVREAASALNVGGLACILGAWVHKEGQAWQSRVASWLNASGVCAWVLQRDVVSPEQYVATWLKDEGFDLRSPEAVARTQQWLDYFAQEEVDAIGFGWLFLQRLSGSSAEVTAEVLDQPFSDPLGPEVDEYFLRMQWLRDRGTEEILDARFLMRPQVAVEEVLVPDAEAGLGFASQLYRVTRMDGPRFSHEIDEPLFRILSGLHPDGLPLREVMDLLALSMGIEENALPALSQQVCSAIVDLVRHGIVLPSDLVEVVQ